MENNISSTCEQFHFYSGDSNIICFKMFMRKQDIFGKSSEEIGKKCFNNMTNGHEQYN